MSFHVHLHVCFACSQNEPVAELARRHRPEIVDNCDGASAAILFLEDLAQRTGPNRGPKGGLSLWGIVGNHTDVGYFCEILKPFWNDLLQPYSDLWSGRRVVVFEEREESGSATAYEICLSGIGVRVIRHPDLPFAWMQL